MFGKTIKAVATAAVMLTGALFTTTAHAQTATNLNCNKCVNTSDIARKAVTSSRLKNNAVTKRKIKNGAVTSQKIAPNAVTTAKIAPGAVDSGALMDASVTPAKLATPDGVAFTPTTVSDTTISATETVRTLTVTLPGPGSVIVFASGYYRMTAVNTRGSCSITKGAIVDGEFEMQFGGNDSPATNHRVPFAGTRGYDEAAGGPVTYNLVCREIAGAFAILNIVMTAIYSATNITTAFTPPAP